MSDLPGDALRQTIRAGFPLPMTTGFSLVDGVTDGGLRRGELSIIGAGTGMGKTAYAEQVALSMSLEFDTLFMPLEMGQRDTLVRMGAKIAKCSYGDFLRTGLDRMTEQQLNVRNLFFFEASTNRRLWVDDVLETIARYRCPLVFLDHVRHIDGWVSDAGGHSSATNIVRKLRDGARELNVHICLCAQLNRLGYGRRPTLANLQDTSALEQLASLVVLLHRPFYAQGAVRDTVTELIVAKNRYGPMCRLHYRWVGQTMTLWDMTPEEHNAVACCRGTGSRHAEDLPAVRDRDDVAAADRGEADYGLFPDEG